MDKKEQFYFLHLKQYSKQRILKGAFYVLIMLEEESKQGSLSHA